MKKCYISGPITGIEGWVVETMFGHMEKVVRSLKMEPVSPLRNGLPEGSTWEQHMKADLKMLMDCEAIIMLEGWRKSRGARIEHRLAEELGIVDITGLPFDDVMELMDSKQ